MVPACALSIAHTTNVKLAISPSRLLGCQVRSRCCREHPAQAHANDMDAVLGRHAHRASGLKYRVGVGVKVKVALLDVRVAPRHHEHLMALLEEVFDQTALRSKVEDVVLVDGGGTTKRGFS